MDTEISVTVEIKPVWANTLGKFELGLQSNDDTFVKEEV